MSVADELVVTALVRDPDKCLRLIQRHTPTGKRCRECCIPATLPQPCRPYRLARIAAHRMESERVRSR
jgi:hypothetical protein